jgi:hypothetical protein
MKRRAIPGIIVALALRAPVTPLSDGRLPAAMSHMTDVWVELQQMEPSALSLFAQQANVPDFGDPTFVPCGPMSWHREYFNAIKPAGNDRGFASLQALIQPRHLSAGLSAFAQRIEQASKPVMIHFLH